MPQQSLVMPQVKRVFMIPFRFSSRRLCHPMPHGRIHTLVEYLFFWELNWNRIGT